MKQRKPMKRSTKPMSRGTKPWKRKKAMKALGKKGKARSEAIKGAVEAYFERFGWLDSEGFQAAFCQLTGRFIRLADANAHHKTPRSEMNKMGLKDLDAPHRLLICDYKAHLWFLHAGQMGRPKEGEARRRFEIAEFSTANAENGEAVEFSGQDRMDLDLYLTRR